MTEKKSPGLAISKAQAHGDFFTIFFTLLNCSCQFLYNAVFKLIRLRSKE